MMKKTIYRSKYEAYPFLCDHSEDLRCDFEIFTDEVASMTGLLRAQMKEQVLQNELLFICELIYHINPSLRTHTTVTKDELMQLEGVVNRLQAETAHRRRPVVVTQGSESAALSHILRVKCKGIVRLLYKYTHKGHFVEDILFDFTNLLSGYFCALTLKLNELDETPEIEYISRNTMLK